jgi:hypothetical protein
MFEVIRRGATAKSPNVSVTCNHCSVRLRFRKSEARFEADQRDGNAYVIRCPACRRDVWVAESVVDRHS